MIIEVLHKIICCWYSLESPRQGDSNEYPQHNEPGHEKMCLMPYANNKGADQPAHPHSLISAFVFAAKAEWYL